MATPATAKPLAPPQSSTIPMLCLLAGWLVPGAGHFILRKPIRGALLLISILAMFSIGIALDGKIYQPNSGQLLDILGFAGELGNGLLYVAARLFDLGKPTMQIALNDYGKTFLVVAGLLNIICAVDAHSLARGRKAS